MRPLLAGIGLAPASAVRFPAFLEALDLGLIGPREELM